MLPGGWLFLIAKVKTHWKWTIQAEEHFTWAQQVIQSPYLSILFSNMAAIDGDYKIIFAGCIDNSDRKIILLFEILEL